MKDRSVTISITSFQPDELDAGERTLIDKAREASHRAYAPYSHFHVGAAILLDNGEIVTGANQENAAFPSGTCAERTAAYWAHANFPDARFKAIAISAYGSDGVASPRVISPCGACRQALLEYETLAGNDVTVLLDGDGDVWRLPSVKSLLPLAFAEF